MLTKLVVFVPEVAVVVTLPGRIGRSAEEALPLVVAVAAGLLGGAGGFEAAANGVVLGDGIEGKISATLVGGGEATVGRGAAAVCEGVRHGCV